jgi:hypothetical protein
LAVVIFPNPAPGEFATVGATAHASNLENLSAPLGTISSADSDLPHIRYTTDGTYEIELPGPPINGFSWHPLSVQGSNPNALTDDVGDLLLSLSDSRDNGYRYSEMAFYSSPDTGQIGAIAFGTLTPMGAVPITGSATYSGTIMGTSDVIASDSFDGPNRASVEGSVNLDFNFAAGSLTGDMAVTLNDAAGVPLSLGTFNFTDTVYSSGSTNYSGKFDSNAAGQNFFLGQFTGPHAEETIGAWALPFILNTGNSMIPADHQTHQAFGAWIARKP